MFVRMFFMLLLACSVPSSSSSHDPQVTQGHATNSTSSNLDIKIELTSLSYLEKRTRVASVKILDQGNSGHGSGAYVLYGKTPLVFTAAHVVNSLDEYIILDSLGNETRAQVLYLDTDIDFAVLKPESKLSVKPIKFKRIKFSIETLIGNEVIFSGYPGRHSLMTVKGSVAGFERGAIMIHSYAWLGSSGSCVFDRHGNFIGVIRALDVGNFEGPQLIEDMIWISPYNSIDWDSLDNALKNTN